MNKILTFIIIFISVKQAFCGDPTLDMLQKNKASLLDTGLIRLNMMMNEGKRQELAKSLSYLHPIVELRDNPKAVLSTGQTVMKMGITYLLQHISKQMNSRIITVKKYRIQLENRYSI